MFYQKLDCFVSHLKFEAKIHKYKKYINNHKNNFNLYKTTRKQKKFTLILHYNHRYQEKL